MRNVNVLHATAIGLIPGGFILTMRNVNFSTIANVLGITPSFILTMRNVNVISRKELAMNNTRFYINYEECKYLER